MSSFPFTVGLWNPLEMLDTVKSHGCGWKRQDLLLCWLISNDNTCAEIIHIGWQQWLHVPNGTNTIWYAKICKIILKWCTAVDEVINNMNWLKKQHVIEFTVSTEDCSTVILWSCHTHTVKGLRHVVCWLLVAWQNGFFMFWLYFIWATISVSSRNDVLSLMVCLYFQ